VPWEKERGERDRGALRWTQRTGNETQENRERSGAAFSFIQEEAKRVEKGFR
jgi:hypothetical protein